MIPGILALADKLIEDVTDLSLRVMEHPLTPFVAYGLVGLMVVGRRLDKLLLT